MSPLYEMVIAVCTLFNLAVAVVSYQCAIFVKRAILNSTRYPNQTFYEEAQAREKENQEKESGKGCSDK